MFTVQKTTVTDTAIETNGCATSMRCWARRRDGAAVLRLHVNYAGAVDLVRCVGDGAGRRIVAGGSAAARRRAGAAFRRGAGGGGAVTHE